MPNIERIHNAALARLTLAAVLFFLITPARADVETETFIQKTIVQGCEILESRLAPEERSQRFRSFMISLTDVGRIARFTLGNYANSATSSELDAFVDAFTEYALNNFEQHLRNYKGQTVTVLGSTDSALDDSVVSADIASPTNVTARPLRAAFRVRRDALGMPIIVDMQIEGVWLSITQRADFTSYVQQNGGKVSALTGFLEGRAAEIRTAIRSAELSKG